MTHQSACLLVADDDPDDVMILATGFESRDAAIPVVHVSDGFELMRYLDDCPGEQLPPVLLMDFKMPHLNGAELLEKLNADHKYDRLVKVIWSTSQLEKDVESCKRLGAFDFLPKPATNDELDQLVLKITNIFEMAKAAT